MAVLFQGLNSGFVAHGDIYRTPSPPYNSCCWMLSLPLVSVDNHLTCWLSPFRIVTDTQITVFTFDDFGKDLIKQFHLSPDGFIQMALQLTFYRWVLLMTLTHF